MDTYTKLIDKEPQKMNGIVTPAGAICGNGDLAVTVENDSGSLLLRVSKCDFWKLSDGGEADGGIKAVCTIKVSGVDFSAYRVEQRMKEGCVQGSFANACVELFVSPDNVIYLAITPLAGGSPCVSVEVSRDCGAVTDSRLADGCEIYTREFCSDDTVEKSAVAVCKRELEGERTAVGSSMRYAFAVVTGFDAADYAAKSLLSAKSADYDIGRQAAKRRWSDFFSASQVTLADKELELFYNGSLYLLACCMGNRAFSPGLYGNFVTGDDSPWHGDYHLNYNYEAPFYALFSSNHVELSDCYLTPLNEFMPLAKQFARDYLGCRGVYYPVGIGPRGIDLSAMPQSKEHGRLFLGQKSNAAYAAVIPVMRWYATYDADCAREKLFPFLSQVAEFWEDYLVKEKGRFVIKNDAVHEVPYYRGDRFKPKRFKRQICAKNSILSLGLVRMVLQCLCDMSDYIEVDSQRVELWRDILEHLSEYPTFIKHGRRCYRYTQKGIPWVSTNSLCIQHIYPAGTVTLSSDSKTLTTARNTYFINDRRLDGNGSVSYLPCGARLGVSADYLIEGLHENIRRFALPNMLFAHEGGCLEHCATIPSTVNEMLMQSVGGVVRLFPCWDGSDADFCNLRADGAFLVSSQMRGGAVGETVIKSERGSTLRLDASNLGEVEIKCIRGRAADFTRQGNLIELRTEPGGEYRIIPDSRC